VILTAAKAIPIESEVARRGGLNLKRHGSELVGPCPVCGGRDRFAVSIRKQVFLCRGCRAGGDVVDLVQFLDDCGFDTAYRTLVGDSRQKTVTKPAKTPDRDVNTGRALKLWADAVPIGGTLAETYLHGRGLHDLPGDDVLRFLRHCPFDGGRQDCLLALYRNIATDAPQAVSRTALDSSGTKIGRMSLGPVGGCAVKVDPDENITESLAVGEGLETVLAGRQLGHRPAWSVGSAGAIKTFPLLSGVTSLSIFVDNDAPDANGRRAGPMAAYLCAARWTAAGVEVHRIVPRRIGTDMADLVAKGVRHG
jgi:hypothetical protein